MASPSQTPKSSPKGTRGPDWALIGMERTMKQITTLGLSLALAIGFATAASAQTTSSSAGNLTTATTSTSTTSTSTTSSTSTTAAKKPTSATAEMVNEAIQRSQAR